jgi:hypothetical protein
VRQSACWRRSSFVDTCPIEEVGGLSIPGILPMTALFMLVVGALASIGPVRRGLRIEPTEALRGQ